MQHQNIGVMEIRQARTAIESHSDCKSSGKLAEMDQIIFDWIKQMKRPLSANQIYKDFDGIFLLPSITAALNRLRYDSKLIIAHKFQFTGMRSKLYYIERKEHHVADVRPLSEVEILKARIKTLELENKRQRVKIEMLTNNFIINK